MHDDRTLVEARLERAMGQFVRPARYARRVPLVLSVWDVPGEPVPVAQALQAAYAPFTAGTLWGRPWSTSWFRLTGQVPEEWAGHRVEVVVDPGFTGDGPGFQAEGLLYDAAGVPLKGIHPRNRHLTVAAPARGGEPVHLLLEAAANPAVLRAFEPTPLGDVLTAGDRPVYRFRSAELAVLDEEVWRLVLDVEVLSELMHELPMDRPRRHEILRALEDMLDALDLHDVSGTAPAARAALADVLSRPASASAHRISARVNSRSRATCRVLTPYTSAKVPSSTSASLNGRSMSRRPKESRTPGNRPASLLWPRRRNEGAISVRR